MSRDDRLFEILRLLQGGGQTRATDLARRLGVSERSIYRDMETLAAAGVPVTGTRGAGYRLDAATTLPPLLLTEAELEALNLGIAVVAEAGDPKLSAAARSLADKLDAAQPERGAAPVADAPTHAFASAARGLSHMGLMRSAIRGRQKLRLTCRDGAGAVEHCTVRPLRLDWWGRLWVLTAWCETSGGFRDIRVDGVVRAEALPELFVDEKGKTLDAYRRR